MPERLRVIRVTQDIFAVAISSFRIPKGNLNTSLITAG